ncbi:MAG TPA: hypothetical protein VMF68_02095, partial [Spirochaetia bacterium]|nr:hypothetical protein [Spirochaetia bacterium]
MATIVALVAVILATTAFGAWATTYYSAANQDATALTSWWTGTNGTGTHPGSFTTPGDVFVIQNGDSMTTSAAWPASGSLGGTGGKLEIQGGGVLTATFAVTLATSGTFKVDSGGAYVHNNTAGFAGSIFRGATSLDDSSTVTLNNSSQVGPSGVTFGNLIVNFTSDPGGSVNCQGGLTTIKGDLTILSTSVREFRLVANTPASVTCNIAGSLLVKGGTFSVSSGTATVALDIGGDFTQTGGTFQSVGVATVTFTGGTSSDVTFSSAGTITSTYINWQVASGKTLALATNFTVQSTSTMTVGGTLANGDTCTISGTLRLNAGGVLSGTAPTYGNSSTLVYAGGSAGSVEWGTGSSVGVGVPKNVTIQAPITLPGNRTVPGTLSFVSPGGTITTGGYTLTASTVAGAGATTGWINGNLQVAVPAGVSTRTFDVGDASGYSPAVVVFGSSTKAGTLAVGAAAATHPALSSSSIDATRYVKRYWTFTNGGVTGTYDATFSFLPGDIQGSGDYSKFIVGKYGG